MSWLRPQGAPERPRGVARSDGRGLDSSEVWKVWKCSTWLETCPWEDVNQTGSDIKRTSYTQDFPTGLFGFSVSADGRRRSGLGDVSLWTQFSCWAVSALTVGFGVQVEPKPAKLSPNPTAGDSGELAVNPEKADWPAPPRLRLFCIQEFIVHSQKFGASIRASKLMTGGICSFLTVRPTRWNISETHSSLDSYSPMR